MISLLIAGALWMVAAVFETGPAEAFGEGGGGTEALIHDSAAVVSFTLIILTIFLAAWRFRSDPPWADFARPTLIWAVLVAGSFMSMALVSEDVAGIAQRVHVAFWLSWMAITAWRIQRLDSASPAQQLSG